MGRLPGERRPLSGSGSTRLSERPPLLGRAARLGRSWAAARGQVRGGAMRPRQTPLTRRRGESSPDVSSTRSADATSADGGGGPWPSLPYAERKDTLDAGHMWTQVVGKIRLTLTPLVNHWRNSTLIVTPRGLST